MAVRRSYGTGAIRTTDSLTLGVARHFTGLGVAVPEWYPQGLCTQTDPEAFFPEKGGSTREAKNTCLKCDVQEKCLEFALANEERFGIWGGKSERERRRIVKQRRNDAEPEPDRVCALEGCEVSLAGERSRKKYCTDEHYRRGAYLARKAAAA